MRAIPTALRSPESPRAELAALDFTCVPHQPCEVRDGLGFDRTLELISGRRLPSPTQPTPPAQPLPPQPTPPADTSESCGRYPLRECTGLVESSQQGDSAKSRCR